MNRMVLVFASVLCCSLWAFAQSATQGYPSGQTAGAPGGATSNGNATVTVDGCLSGSDGNYVLKDKTSGTSYNLAGNTTKLGPHVGHEVQVTGTASTASSGANSGASSTASGAMGAQTTLRITSFKHVSASCNAGQ